MSNRAPNKTLAKSGDSPEQHFEKRAAKYARSGLNYEEQTYGAKHLQLYRDLRNDEIEQILRTSFSEDRSLQILEVGCGTGTVLEQLATRFPQHQIHGVDASETMLDQARSRICEQGLSVHLASASGHALPFADSSLDAVLATRFIHLFPHDEKKAIYAEFRRVLRPGGIIAVEYYSRPFAWVRFYLLGERKRKNKDEFFSHYPTAVEVRDIVGGTYRKVAVRIAGSRVIFRLFGRRLLRALTRVALSIPGLHLLVDEYFVITRK